LLPPVRADAGSHLATSLAGAYVIGLPLPLGWTPCVAVLAAISCSTRRRRQKRSDGRVAFAGLWHSDDRALSLLAAVFFHWPVYALDGRGFRQQSGHRLEKADGPVYC